LHYETASTTQQPRGEHRGTIKDCKIAGATAWQVAGATAWQGQGNHTFTTVYVRFFYFFVKLFIKLLSSLISCFVLVLVSISLVFVAFYQVGIFQFFLCFVKQG